MVTGQMSSNQPCSQKGVVGKEPINGLDPDKDTSNKKDLPSKLYNGCLAKTKENPRYEVTSPNVGNHIQYMKDHTIIGKFMGIWISYAG
jgi:hypothetical protein